jgi:hypothetical protein
MFSLLPKKIQEVNPDTPMVFLVSRGDPSRKSEYILNNNKFHKAILENNSVEVQNLLSDEEECKHINDLSLLNTPLLLALKTGAVEIALQILEKVNEVDLNINQKDMRGLTVLDWACILRDNNIIQKILLNPDLQLSKLSYAKAIYSQPAKVEIFTKFLKEIKADMDKIIPEHGCPKLYIFCQEPYSDLIYFMRDVCVNLNFMKDQEFPSSEGLSSHEWFYKCFEKGYERFCAARNAIPINKSLLNAMLSQDLLEMWREKESNLEAKEDDLSSGFNLSTKLSK